MRNTVIISLFLAAIIFTAATAWQKRVSPSSPDQQEQISLPTEPRVPHPVSLPALVAKDIRGTDFTIGRVLDENDVYTRYYITYRSGDLTISGIMNVPKGGGPFPLLIINHGYIDPVIYTNGRGLKREQDYLARQGYVVLHPDYRNHADSDNDPEAELQLRLGYIEDAIAAIYALQTANLPFVNAERVGMLGHSMGGGVTLGVLVTRPELVDATVLFAPVSSDARDNFARWTERRPEVAERIRERYGSPEENPTFWNDVSPISFMHGVTAPILMHHGTNDESVPLRWSEKLAAALTQADKNVTLEIYKNEPHEFTAAWPLVMERTVSFFNKELR